MKQIIIIISILFSSLAGFTQDIVYFEYYVDEDPGYNLATEIPVSQAPLAELNFTVPTAGLAKGFHYVGMRGRDENTNWSSDFIRLFYLDMLQSENEPITYVEYFLDEDPGIGNATEVPITPGKVVEMAFEVDIEEVEPGFHFVNIRSQSENGTWSHAYTQLFLLDQLDAGDESITYVEYFLDEDPGIGNATAVPITPGKVVEMAFEVDIEEVEPGFHFVNIRSQSESGTWSHAFYQMLYIDVLQSSSTTPITYVEYYLDDDPGYGEGTPVDIIPASVVDLNIITDISGLEPGFHTFAVRAQDEDGIWSASFVRMFYIENVSNMAPNLVAVEYFLDEDPGVGNGSLANIDPPVAVADQDFVVELGEVEPGEHILYMRAVDEFDNWSIVAYDTVLVELGSDFALRFDGEDDYLEAGDFQLPANDLTIEAWINPADMENTAEILFAFGEGVGVQLRLNSDGSLLYGESAGGSWNYVMSEPASILPNRWTHVAMTKAGDLCTLYINGIFAGFYQFDNDPATHTLNIGGRSTNMDRFFDGDIDEVRIWETARTQQEIIDNLCATITGNETGIYGLWHFNDGAGSAVASDAGPNGFGAWLYNMNPDPGIECSWFDHECTLPPALDMAITAITSPDDLILNTKAENTTVSVQIKNYGTETFDGEIDFSLTLDDDLTAEATQSLTIPAGESVVYDFSDQVDLSAVGNHILEANIAVSGDEYPENNNLEKSIETVEIARKAYAYNTYGNQSGLPGGPVIFDLYDPGHMFILDDQSNRQYVAGATWVNNRWFGVSNDSIFTLDTLTGQRSFVALQDNFITALAWDETNQKLFGLSWVSLYEIDPETGSTVYIGYTGLEGFTAMACATNGNLFALNVEDDQLYKISSQSGEATLVGPIGFDAGYEQDMEFDPETGVLYLTTFNSTEARGELRTADTLSGNTTLAGITRGGMELSGFVIPPVYTPPVTNNHALHFDGADDWVEIPDLICPQLFTIECWVNFQGGLDASYLTLVEFANDSPWIGVDQGRPVIYNAVTNTNQLTEGWHHLAFVVGVNYSQVFVDGVEAGLNYSRPSISGQPGMGIGYHYGDDYWEGMVDEFRVWDYDRSEAEIVASKNTELSGDESGLVAYYNFNQGIAGGNNNGITSLFNSATSKDYNGTLHNFGLTGQTSNFVDAGWTVQNLNADFYAVNLSGKAPLEVSFFDLSSGEPLSWLWEFGDGNTSTAENPVHVYTDPGIYTVSLTISNEASSDTETKEAYIEVEALTIYDIQFTEDPGAENTYPSPYAGTIVSISGLVTAENVNQTANAFFLTAPEGGPWNGIFVYNADIEPAMGDEVIVTGLVSEYNGLTEIHSPEGMILSSENALPFPSVISTGDLLNNSTGEPLEGVVVSVEDVSVTQSVNQYGNWYVDDGSGECQVDDRCYHYDAESGEILTFVTGPVYYGYDAYVINPRNAEDIGNAVFGAEFSAGPSTGFTPLTVNFSDLSFGDPDAWFWDFGDGQTSTLQNPSHVYEGFGMFDVSLTVYKDGAEDTETKENLIEVYQHQNGDWSLQHICLENTPEAELMIRAGDIDNLGFGWPDGFDPFTGQSTPEHGFPWDPDPEDTGGTDRIMVVSSYTGENVPCWTDGYTSTTGRPGNLPEPVVIDLCQLSQGEITSAALQIFVDDIQPLTFCSAFTVTLNGETFVPLQTIINHIDQSGPIGRMLTVRIPDELLYLLQGDQLELEIDDFTTGAGDGFAIDFVKLLINESALANSGTINGNVYDNKTGLPVEGAEVEASFWETGITIADGSYFISEAPAGLVYLECRAEGYQTDYTLVNLANGQNPEIDFWLEPALVADFSAVPLSGSAPLQVEFTDLTSGNPASWEWNFGDGTTGNEQNPQHIYFTPGLYTVSLVVSNGDDDDEITRMNYINVTAAGTGNWLAEYFYDEDPGYGNGVPVYGNGDEDAMISFNAPISHLADGLHTFCLRSKHEDGSWSQTMSRTFLKQYLPQDAAPGITYLEYFFDSDPGFGQATPIAVDANSPLEIALNLPLDELDYGMHTLYVRSQDENGRWSIVMQRTFIMGNYPANPLKELVKAEYFIDEDPGQGNAEPVMFDPNSGIHEQEFDADLNGLEWGEHTLYMRTMDESGSWSITVAEPFDVEEPPIIAEFSADITEGSVPLTVQFTDETFVSEPDEWLWDFGDGNTSALQNPVHVYADPGVYTVSLTATGPVGTDTEVKEDFITIYPPLYSLEYFFDEDPGYGNGNGVYAYSSNLGGFDFLVPVDELDDGYHLLFVRVQDTANVWTQTFTRSILKTRLPLDPSPDIAAVEYFLDNDPGFGQGNSLPVPQSHVPVVDALIPLDGVEDGLHNIYVRSQDENGRWSETFTRPFLKSYVPGEPADVARLEYFIDADPGAGNGSPVDIPDPQPDVERSFVVNLAGQAQDEHKLFVRAIDSRGSWSIVYSELFEVTASGAVQVVQLPEGWSGISSYVIPGEPAVDEIFAPVENELVILQNFTGIFWPTAGVNTLGNWDDHAGYQIKMETAQQVTFSGSMQNNLTANLSAGWNYLPVLNACDNDANELFTQISGQLQIVKEVAGTGVYWPQFGINTLGAVQPGKAYFVLVDEDVSLAFAECTKDLSAPKVSGVNRTGLKDEQILSDYNIHKTPLSHTIAFSNKNYEGLETGDIISIYNQQGICCGAVVFQNQNFVLTAFGDDPTTPQVDGLLQGEPLRFRVTNPESGKSAALDVEFDYSMPQGETFGTHGLSAVKGFTVNEDGGLSESRTSISIYPNPSSGIFEVHVDQSGFSKLTGLVSWELTNSHGSVVATGRNQPDDFTIDISTHPKGIYYLKIIQGGLQVIEKLVLQ